MNDIINADETTQTDIPADTVEVGTPDDGYTFPGDFITRYANGTSIRHHHLTRDDFDAQSATEVPAQVLSVEQV